MCIRDSNNRNFESFVNVVKVDAESGKSIPYAGAGFKIYDPQGVANSTNSAGSSYFATALYTERRERWSRDFARTAFTHPPTRT